MSNPELEVLRQEILALKSKSLFEKIRDWTYPILIPLMLAGMGAWIYHDRLIHENKERSVSNSQKILSNDVRIIEALRGVGKDEFEKLLQKLDSLQVTINSIQIQTADRLGRIETQIKQLEKSQ